MLSGVPMIGMLLWNSEVRRQNAHDAVAVVAIKRDRDIWLKDAITKIQQGREKEIVFNITNSATNGNQ